MNTWKILKVEVDDIEEEVNKLASAGWVFHSLVPQDLFTNGYINVYLLVMSKPAGSY